MIGPFPLYFDGGQTPKNRYHNPCEARGVFVGIIIINEHML